MAQHKCITQLAKNVYRARPTAGILTVDSGLNNYSFRLKKHTLRGARPRLYILFLHTQPNLSAVRDPRTRRSYILGSTYSVTTYLLLHSCPMDNTWHARGTGQCPSDPRFTKIKKQQNYKMAI